jgi:hypothetical protein
MAGAHRIAYRLAGLGPHFTTMSTFAVQNYRERENRDRPANALRDGADLSPVKEVAWCKSRSPRPWYREGGNRGRR